MMQKIKIIVASSNVGKIKEIKAILGQKYEVLSKAEVGILQEIDENATDFMGNAMLKAKGIYTQIQEQEFLVLSDDSGLCVDALNGEPGVHSARYASLDRKSNTSDAANRNYLIKQLQLHHKKNSPARFICAMVLYGRLRGKEICIQAQGECVGKVYDNQKGTGGFGYDSLFEPDGDNRRIAQLSQEEKNQVSHRSKALKALFLNFEQSINA